MTQRLMTYEVGNMLFDAVDQVIKDPSFAYLKALTCGALVHAHNTAEKAIAEREAYEGHIQSARDNYASDELEIDDDPVLSVADDGVWVSAWVWVATDGDDE